MSAAAQQLGAVSDADLDQYVEKMLRPCLANPRRWIHTAYEWGRGELKGMHPHAWQTEVAEYVSAQLDGMRRGTIPRKAVRVSIKSGHGVGKSAFMAMFTDWGMSTMNDCNVLLTAGKETQLRTKTMPEVAKWHRLSISKQFFTATAMSLFSTEPGHSKSWLASAEPWSEENSEAFQGLHNRGKRIIVIFDEASAIPSAIWAAIEGAMTDADTEIIWLAFGNPTRNSGRFYDCFNARKEQWHHITIDSRDVPGAVNLLEVEGWAKIEGEDSDFMRVRVKGEFPRASAEQFIAGDVVAEAMNREAHSLSSDPLLCGIDFARSGNCANVMYWRRGRDAKSVPPDVYREEPDSEEFIAKCVNRLRDMKPDIIYGDGVGVGGPMVDRLRKLGFNIMDVQAAGRPADPSRHLNIRAECWATGKAWLQHGGALWSDESFQRQLTTIESVANNKMLTQLESKQRLMKRGEPSPDEADAFMLTFAGGDSEQPMSSAEHRFDVEQDYRDEHRSEDQWADLEQYEPRPQLPLSMRHLAGRMH